MRGVSPIRSSDALIALFVCPGAILLDVMLSDLSGFEVARRLRADPQMGSTPIIMIAALREKYGQEGRRDRGE